MLLRIWDVAGQFLPLLFSVCLITLKLRFSSTVVLKQRANREKKLNLIYNHPTPQRIFLSRYFKWFSRKRRHDQDVTIFERLVVFPREHPVQILSLGVELVLVIPIDIL